MSLKKLNDSIRGRRAPQFVDQTESAKQREDDDECGRGNAYLHGETGWLTSKEQGAKLLLDQRTNMERQLS